MRVGHFQRTELYRVPMPLIYFRLLPTCNPNYVELNKECYALWRSKSAIKSTKACTPANGIAL